MTEIGWVDHDAAQQRLMRALIDSQSEKEAVDELGLGVVRDAISDALFPGVSVLHNRARYLLFVAWIYQDLLNAGVSGRRAIERGRRQEVALIHTLIDNYGSRASNEGIIGQRAREKLKRLPSAVYWAALRRYGIRHEALSGSVESYCALLGRYQSATARSGLFRSSDDVPEDPLLLWAEFPEPDPDWMETATFDLTEEEAVFLRERMLTCDHAGRRDPAQESLLSWLVRRDEWVGGVGSIRDHPHREQFPETARELVSWGTLFDISVHGARLLYNLLCSKAKGLDEHVEGYRAELAEWQAEAHGYGLPASWPSAAFWSWLARTRPSGLGRVQHFHRQWMDVFGAGTAVADSDRARAIIEHRERSLKQGLARLRPGSRRLDTYEGDAGVRRFDYNWRPARQLLADIHTGLRTPRVEAVS